MAGEPDPNTTQADAEAHAGNVVFLGSAGNLTAGVAAGSGDDTIGVSGNVLAFNRPATMAFLDDAEAGLAGGASGSAAVPGGLGSLTLFNDPLLGNDLVAMPAGGGLPGYFSPVENAGGALGAPAAHPDPAAAYQPASVSGGSTLHLPDGTTVMLVDITKLTGSAPF